MTPCWTPSEVPLPGTSKPFKSHPFHLPHWAHLQLLSTVAICIFVKTNACGLQMCPSGTPPGPLHMLLLLLEFYFLSADLFLHMLHNLVLCVLSTRSLSGAPVYVGPVQYLKYSKNVKYLRKFNELLQGFSLLTITFILFWDAWLRPSFNFICTFPFVLWVLSHLSCITFNSVLSRSYKTFSKEKCSREADGEGWEMKCIWEWCTVYYRISGPPDTSSGW